MSEDENVKNEMLTIEELNEIDKSRIKKAQWAEFADSWRIVPRLLVVAYAWLTWKVVYWYMHIPLTLETCQILDEKKICIVEKAGPTTQHAALVTAVMGQRRLYLGFTQTLVKTGVSQLFLGSKRSRLKA